MVIGREWWDDRVTEWVRETHTVSRVVLIVLYVVLIVALVFSFLAVLAMNLNAQESTERQLRDLSRQQNELALTQREIKTRVGSIEIILAKHDALVERLAVVEADRVNDRWVLVSIIGILIVMGTDRLRTIINEKQK